MSGVPELGADDGPAAAAEHGTRSPLAGVALAIVGGAAVAGAVMLMLSTGPNTARASAGTNESYSTFFVLMMAAAGLGAAGAGATELDSIPAGITGQLTGAVIAFMGAGIYIAVAGNELTGSDIGVVLYIAFGTAIGVGLVQAAAVAVARRRRGGRRARGSAT